MFFHNPDSVQIEVVADIRVGNEYFVLKSDGRRVFWLTNIKTDEEALFIVFQKCDSAGIDNEFTAKTLFRESRLGANTRHKENDDGSRDGGWFGINSIHHPVETMGNPLVDVYKFIDYCKKYLFPFPRSEWTVRYIYGEPKAKELGLIK